MPTLQWLGKEKVITHHLAVPFCFLEKQYTFQDGAKVEGESENKIIQGDNLLALKSLLPEYAGKVKCIYIDPPYNTGNEGWVYNDNVNDPKIKKWLGQVVGKEGEDLSRHDKWLCMMYPRLVLLHRLLAEDGVIFVSIDENEHRYLELILDEIFGPQNRIETIIWKKSYGGGSKSNFIVNLHEYILCIAKDISKIEKIELPPDLSVLKYYKYSDDKYTYRGPYRLQPLATTSMDDRPNLRYPIFHDGHEIWPDKQWQWSQQRVIEAQKNDDLVFSSRNGKWTVNYKQYLKDEKGQERKSKPFSIVDNIYTQSGTKENAELFGNGKVFSFPKPSELVKLLLQMVTEHNDIILDSFAGSGTTAHAVLNLNKQDGGNRKFILVEMMDYAESITAERVRRVINGYGNTPGTGGGFSYYTLGEPLFDQDASVSVKVTEEKLRTYVYFMETKQRLPKRDKQDHYLLGVYADTAFYFYYKPGVATTLNTAFLNALPPSASRCVIYASRCTVSREELNQRSITFKKIPRDISRL